MAEAWNARDMYRLSSGLTIMRKNLHWPTRISAASAHPADERRRIKRVKKEREIIA